MLLAKVAVAQPVLTFNNWRKLMPNDHRFGRTIAHGLTAAFLAILVACGESPSDPAGPTQSAPPPPASAPASPEAYKTACSRTDIGALIDGFAMRPAVRLALKIKVNLYIALSKNGPSPQARAKLQDLIGELLERAKETSDPAQRDRIEAVIGLLFCILGESPPALDLNAGQAALVTPSTGATLTLPCEIDCTAPGRNLAGVIIPAEALPDNVPFVLVSLAPTTDTLPTPLPRREPTFRISLSPQVNLILPAVVGACIDGANVPTDGELVLARAAGTAGAITPGNERDGELEIVRVDASEAEAAALELDCLPTAPTVVGRALDLLLPSQLHATMWLFGRAFSARAAPAGVWGGVVRLPRSAILAVSPTTATFTTSVGGAAPAPVTIAVSNTGIESAITDLAVGTITYGSGASGWLAATLASQVANTTLALQANQTGLTEGVYTATVPVTSSQASNSPRTIAVTLRVNGIPQIALASTSATFNSVAGEPNPPPVTIAITNGGQGTLASLFAGSPTYGPGATNWLSATINPSTAPTALTLTPQLTNVPPGTYTATCRSTPPMRRTARKR